MYTVSMDQAFRSGFFVIFLLFVCNTFRVVCCAFVIWVVRIMAMQFISVSADSLDNNCSSSLFAFLKFVFYLRL